MDACNLAVGDLMKVTGLGYHLVRTWSRTGLLRFRQGQGPGKIAVTTRWYPDVELAIVATIKVLRSLGWSLQKIRKLKKTVFSALRDSPDPSIYSTIMIDGSSGWALLTAGNHQIAWRSCSVVDLSRVWGYLRTLRDPQSLSKAA